MIRPGALKKDEPLVWSTGAGTDVWDFFCAAMTGDLDAIQRLLKKDPSLVRSQYHYRKPIYFAVREGQLEATRHLLQKGANPQDSGADDPLPEIARYRGYTELLALLEDTLAEKYHIDPRGEVVAAAIRSRDLQKVKTLLDAEPALLPIGDAHGNQTIHWAVMTRQPDIIDELLARGADINARRPDGARPIQLCNGDYSFRGWRDVPAEHPVTPRQVLQHLRARGVYVDICTACYIGDFQRVQELTAEDPSLANKPDAYVTYYACSGTPIRNAAAGGHKDIVLHLLKIGADPNLPEEHIAPYGHALHMAVCNGHRDIVQLLLDHGAYPNVPVESSADTLSAAMRNNDQPMVELLCSYGASRKMELLAYYGDIMTAAAVLAVKPELAYDPDALGAAADEGKDSFVRLLLHYQPGLIREVSRAAKTPELTQFLFSKGMDPNYPDWLMVTPLHRFARAGDVVNAGIFLDHGADIHARDEDISSTPLGWAAKYGKIEMVEFLLQRGARPQLPDDPPWATPLAWARYKGHTDIVRLLERELPNGSGM